MTAPVKFGFTLAELLISLGILGVIATFTIPKVLTSQQNSKYNSIAKEVAGAMSQAMILYKRDQGAIQAGTTMGSFTPYLNYVAVDTLSTVDDVGGGTFTCPSTGNGTCIRLHNGATIWYRNAVSFGGTGNLNAIYFKVDPTGVADTTTAVDLFMYINGKITDEGHIDANTVSSDFTRSPNLSLNPSWWSDWQ